MSNAKKFANHLVEHGEKLAERLPEGKTTEDLKRLALYLVAEDGRSGGKLGRATPGSLFRCILRAWHLDLDLDLGEAHLVTYGNEANLQIDYKGLIKLAKRSGEVTHVKADVVRDGDAIEYSRGTHAEDRYLVHKPKAFNDADVIGAYALFHLADGSVEFEVMNLAEIKTTRSKAAGGSMMWKEFFHEGAKKAVLRRGLKTLELVPEDKRAMLDSDRREYELAGQSTEKRDLNTMFQGGQKQLDDTPISGEVFDDSGEPEREAVPVEADTADSQEGPVV